MIGITTENLSDYEFPGVITGYPLCPREMTQKGKNSMIETTYIDSKVKKYHAWRASNYYAMAEWEAPYSVEAVRLADARKGQRILVAECGTGGMDGSKCVGPTGRVNISEGQSRAKMEKLGLGGPHIFSAGKCEEVLF